MSKVEIPENEVELMQTIGILPMHMRDKIPGKILRLSEKGHRLVFFFGDLDNTTHALSHLLRTQVMEYPVPCMASLTKLYEFWGRSKSTGAEREKALELLRRVENCSHLGLYFMSREFGVSYLRFSDIFKGWFSDLLTQRWLSGKPTSIAMSSIFLKAGRLRHFIPEDLMNHRCAVDVSKLYGSKA